MEDILLIHRKANSNLSFQGSVWKTCLRQIYFCRPSELHLVQALPSDSILQEESAISFLIEVLCGLHSPIVGETEVFGQFKQFTEARREAGDLLFHPQQRWLQFVMNEVKKVRAQHLIGIGSHSYGSLIRKLTKEFDQVTVLGGGQLTSEILPWLSAKKVISVVSRSPEKLTAFTSKLPQLILSNYFEAAPTNEVMIIAGAVPDEQIQQFLLNQTIQPKVIIDLRGELNSLKRFVPAGTRLVVLTEFFKQLEDSKKELEEKITILQIFIRAQSLDFINRVELRPLGWDDLCA